MGQESGQNRMQEIREAVKAADMVLVGLGEEFDDLRIMRNAEGYEQGKKLLEGSEQSFLIPAWQRRFREKEPEGTARRKAGLQKLADCLAGKNYFVVSVAANNEIAQLPWREGRLVMPCGSDTHWQCDGSCEENLRLLRNEELAGIGKRLEEWIAADFQGGADALAELSGNCPHCGKKRGLNNIYHMRYDENGYLPDWQSYTKWLQGTLNKNVLVLELGVGMRFPSVIRFPFEKIAYFNQKAKFYRVHENLYQLTEELAEKGTGIAKNAIDWLQNLC